MIWNHKISRKNQIFSDKTTNIFQRIRKAMWLPEFATELYTADLYARLFCPDCCKALDGSFRKYGLHSKVSFILRRAINKETLFNYCIEISGLHEHFNRSSLYQSLNLVARTYTRISSQKKHAWQTVAIITIVLGNFMVNWHLRHLSR